MKILVLTPWWPREPDDPYGSFVRDQARALKRLGEDVRVGVLSLVRPWARGESGGAAASVAFPPDEPSTSWVVGPWLPYRLGYDLLLATWTRLLARLVLKQGKWARDALLVVHTQDLAVPAARVAKGVGLRYVMVAHGLEPDSPRYLRRDRFAAYRRALEGAARILAVGPGLARHLSREAPDADVRMVLNGYEEELVERVRNLPGSGNGTPRIVSVSNLVEGKGVGLTIEALAARRAAGLSVPVYDVVGDGPERGRLEAAARGAGLASEVRFHGRLPRERALGLVRGARAFVLASRPEACGVAYMEAMALGVAPVAAVGEGPSAFIEDGRSGLLVEPTTAGVGGALSRVLDTDGEADRVGARAAAAARGLGWVRAAASFVQAVPPAPPARTRPPKTWLSVFNEPTPYVTATLDAAEETGLVRFRRAWLSVNSSQAWGEDARYREEDVLDRPSRVAAMAFASARGRYDGVHAGGWGGRWAMPALFAAAWVSRTPLSIDGDTHVSTSRGIYGAARRLYLRWLDRRVWCWLPAGTPQAEHLRLAAAPRAPVVVARMTTDTRTLTAEARRLGPAAGSAWRGEHAIPAGAPLVLFVGRIAPEKGVADLLSAVKLISDEGVALWLVLLGPGDAGSLLPLGFPRDRLTAPGRVAWRALVPAYLAADVVVLPSRSEGWGLVVNEALLLGCPVVVTDRVGAARDLVLRPGAGVVVPVSEPAALANGIRQVLDAGGRSSEFARRGRECIRGWTTDFEGHRLAGILSGRRLLAC